MSDISLVEIESYTSELLLAKMTYLRYNILRILYPYKRMSFKEIQSALKLDKSNLSRKIQDLKEQKLVIVTKEQRGKGAPSQIFTLSNDGRKILNPIVELNNPQTSNIPPLPDGINLKNYLMMLIREDEENVIDSTTQDFIVDEIQILTRKFYIPIDDDLLVLYEKAIMNKKLNKKIRILLISINYIMTNNNDDKTLEKIEDKLGYLFLSLKNKEHISDSTKKIAGEINEKLKQSIKSYQALKTRYIHSIKNATVWIPQIGDIRKKILALHPLKKHELRFELINEFINPNDKLREILVQEISQLR